MSVYDLRKDGYGPLINQKGFEVIPKLIGISEKAWELYSLSCFNGQKLEKDTSLDVLSKLVYYAQNCSYSISLLTRWGQSLEALILLRTRYEQVITASYLIHANKENGIDLFSKSSHRSTLSAIDKYRKSQTPITNIIKELFAEYIDQSEDELINHEKKLDSSIKKGDKYKEKWTAINKQDLAKKRDELSKNKHSISDFSLESYYHSLFRLASGVSHVEPCILTESYLLERPDRLGVFPQPLLTFTNLIQCAHFDIVQSFETTNYFGIALVDEYVELHEEYKSIISELISPDDFVKIFLSKKP